MRSLPAAGLQKMCSRDSVPVHDTVSGRTKTGADSSLSPSKPGKENSTAHISLPGYVRKQALADRAGTAVCLCRTPVMRPSGPCCMPSMRPYASVRSAPAYPAGTRAAALRPTRPAAASPHITAAYRRGDFSVPRMISGISSGLPSSVSRRRERDSHAIRPHLEKSLKRLPYSGRTV